MLGRWTSNIDWMRNWRIIRATDRELEVGRGKRDIRGVVLVHPFEEGTSVHRLLDIDIVLDHLLERENQLIIPVDDRLLHENDTRDDLPLHDTRDDRLLHAIRVRDGKKSITNERRRGSKSLDRLVFVAIPLLRRLVVLLVDLIEWREIRGRIEGTPVDVRRIVLIVGMVMVERGAEEPIRASEGEGTKRRSTNADDLRVTIHEPLETHDLPLHESDDPSLPLLASH